MKSYIIRGDTSGRGPTYEVWSGLPRFCQHTRVRPPCQYPCVFHRRQNIRHFKTSEPEQWRFSIRVSPDRFVELTDVPGIKPAHYFARFHWVSIVNSQSLSEAYLRELILWSYKKALGLLSRAQQGKCLGKK